MTNLTKFWFRHLVPLAATYQYLVVEDPRQPPKKFYADIKKIRPFYPDLPGTYVRNDRSYFYPQMGSGNEKNRHKY